MKLFLDGVETAWPREIVVEVEGFEEAGPLLIRIVGGVLHIRSSEEPKQAVSLAMDGSTATVPMPSPAIEIRGEPSAAPRRSLILGGSRYDKVQQDRVLSGQDGLIMITGYGEHTTGGQS